CRSTARLEPRQFRRLLVLLHRRDRLLQLALALRLELLDEGVGERRGQRVPADVLPAGPDLELRPEEPPRAQLIEEPGEPVEHDVVLGAGTRRHQEYRDGELVRLQPVELPPPLAVHPLSYCLGALGERGLLEAQSLHRRSTPRLPPRLEGVDRFRVLLPRPPQAGG